MKKKFLTILRELCLVNKDPMFQVRVPASTANLGSGFDSIGLAVNLYCTLTGAKADVWSFEFCGDAGIRDLPLEKNLIYKVIVSMAEKYGCKPIPHHIVVHTDIPLERGLGSSAAALIGGIEVANEIFSLGLTRDEKLANAIPFEGHIDNIGAALFGGLLIGTAFNDEFYYASFDFPTCDCLAIVPPYALSTEDSRKVLPENFSRAEAVKGSGIANVLVAALAKGDMELAGKMMMKDVWHEPYRAKLMPELKQLKAKAGDLHIYAALISGAGSTMFVFAKSGDGMRVLKEMECLFPHCKLLQLEVDTVGAVVIR